MLSDGATTRVDCGSFLGVDVEPLDIGTANRLLLVVGEVEVRVGIDLRRETQVEVGEEAETLEARVDLNTTLVIEARTDEVADVVIPPRSIEVSRGDTS